MAKRKKSKLASEKYLIGINMESVIATFISQEYTSVVLFYDVRLKKYADRFVKLLAVRHSLKCLVIPITAGEKLKSLQSIEHLATTCANHFVGRKTVFMAMGGGTVGDAVGFLASVYMRGVPWLSVPSTLLSQVDSSYGGKTAVNAKNIKNLIGTFHQPRMVFCDTTLLSTLEDREIVSGLGEIIKYALAFDKLFFGWLEKNIDDVLQKDPTALKYAVEKSLHWKAHVVSKDELDTAGIREALNFGHTFAHALESYAGHGQYQHGEAVIWGMRYELSLSLVKKMITEAECLRAMKLLERLPVKSLPSRASLARLVSLMRKDKKSIAGDLRFVLSKGIGKVIVRQAATKSEMTAAWQLMTKKKRKVVDC